MTLIPQRNYIETKETITSHKNMVSWWLKNMTQEIRWNIKDIIIHSEKQEISNSLKELRDLEKSWRYVFHGSIEDISILEPKQAYNYKTWIKTEDWQKAIFATEYADIAIFRSLINHKNTRWDSHNNFWVYNYKPVFYLTSNLLESARRKTGKIYVFEKEKFTDFSPMECRCYAKLLPIKVINVEYQDLPKNIEVIENSVFDDKMKEYTKQRKIDSNNFKKGNLKLQDKDFYKMMFKRYECHLQEHENKDKESISLLIKEFKSWNISKEEFGNIRSLASDKSERIRSAIADLKEKLRILNIEEMIIKTKDDQKIKSLDYLDGITDIESMLLWDIQKGWSNASGVFWIKSQPNLVAIKKTIWNYQFLWDMPYYYSRLWDSPNFPRVLKLINQSDSTYIIMEKATWIQLDHITSDEMEKIPQEHYNEFVKNIIKLEGNWILIDPSKSSNFFYDSKIGFIFIDLSSGAKDNSKYYKNWLLQSILSKKVKEISINEKSTFSDIIKEKVESALLANWINQ